MKNLWNKNWRRLLFAVVITIGLHSVVDDLDSNLVVERNMNINIERNNQTQISNIPYLEVMQKKSLILSYRQQLKLFSVKDYVIPFIRNNTDYNHLYHVVDDGGRFAYILNDHYAFRHIFKNGGTAVEKQVRHEQVRKKGIGDRKLVAVVRDPVDHFLSGWAECGKRGRLDYSLPLFPKFNDSTYDDRIRLWLADIQAEPPREGIGGCRPHSYPQANFLLHGNSIHPELDLIGDLRELPEVLRLVGFRFNQRISKMEGENAASESKIKGKLYPKRVDLISDKTMKELCSYLALDYYLFDFEPPKVCMKDVFALPMLDGLL